MSATPRLPSDFLGLVVLLCRHLPARTLTATIDWHLYGPSWAGNASDLEDQLLRNTLHASYSDVTCATCTYFGLPDELVDGTD
jgi:hypothetical protein